MTQLERRVQAAIKKACKGGLMSCKHGYWLIDGKCRPEICQGQKPLK